MKRVQQFACHSQAESLPKLEDDCRKRLDPGADIITTQYNDYALFQFAEGTVADLYNADVLAWSERQAWLLQQHAAGKPGNELPDWANIIEGVERIGRDQLHAVEQLLLHAMAQMLKAYAWPLHREVPFWQAEARKSRDDAAARITPSMR